MKSTVSKKILWAVFSMAIGIGGAFLLIDGGSAVYASLNQKTEVAVTAVKETASAFASQVLPATPPPSPVHLTFVGDIMLGRGVKSSVYKNFAGDYNQLFQTTLPYFTTDDITFANLEGPISSRGVDLGSKFSFRFEPKVAEVLKNSGVDIVSVANNHEGDWSRVAYDDTLKYLTDAGVLFAGGNANYADATTPTIIEKNGLKIGYIGFTDVGPHWMPADATHSGVLLADDPDFDTIVQNASKSVDILIVSFHFGVEYNVGHHTTRQEELAHRAIDDGAKIVAGHHPHVEEDTEEYNGGFIMYSLGNFIFDQPFSTATMQGLMEQVTLDKSGIISHASKIVKLNRLFQPTEIVDEN